jgi:hypothetical protein
LKVYNYAFSIFEKKKRMLISKKLLSIADRPADSMFDCSTPTARRFGGRVLFLKKKTDRQSRPRPVLLFRKKKSLAIIGDDGQGIFLFF